jgi:HD-like signal output (HDOD) protein
MGISLDVRQYLATQPIDLPVFNPVALNILQLTSNPDTDIEDIIRAINEDQSLAAQILKMANSPVFMGLSKMETIKASVIRLGSRQVANLAMTASQASLHTSDDIVINGIMQELYCHSNACAIGCWWVAQQTGQRNLAEQAYMAGLIHDIGKLYLLKALEQLNSSSDPAKHFDRGLFLGAFSDMHIEEGCRIMDHWNLPPIYRSVVANHHTEKFDPDETLLAIVRLVNVVTRKYGLSLNPDQTSDIQQEKNVLAMDESRCAELNILMKGYFEISQ